MRIAPLVMLACTVAACDPAIQIDWGPLVGGGGQGGAPPEVDAEVDAGDAAVPDLGPDVEPEPCDCLGGVELPDIGALPDFLAGLPELWTALGHAPTWRPPRTAESSVDGCGRVIEQSDSRYQYDELGNLTRAQVWVLSFERVAGLSTPFAAQATHRYDAAGRRTQTIVMGDVHEVPMANLTVNYTYDNQGRIATADVYLGHPRFSRRSTFEHLPDRTVQHIVDWHFNASVESSVEHPPAVPAGAAACEVDAALAPGRCFGGHPSQVGVGECRAGEQQAGACEGGVDPAVEVPDGRDNDCDGASDEGLHGAPCAVDGCRAGVWVVHDGGAVCVGAAPARPEVCNREDDDCDGQIDEGVEGPCECEDMRWRPIGGDFGGVASLFRATEHLGGEVRVDGCGRTIEVRVDEAHERQLVATFDYAPGGLLVYERSVESRFGWPRQAAFDVRHSYDAAGRRVATYGQGHQDDGGPFTHDTLVEYRYDLQGRIAEIIAQWRAEGEPLFRWRSRFEHLPDRSVEHVDLGADGSEDAAREHPPVAPWPDP